jgi:hypothetical protein
MICFASHCDGEVAHRRAISVVDWKGDCCCSNGHECTSRCIGDTGRNQSIHATGARRNIKLIAEVICSDQVGGATRGGDASCSVVAGFKKRDVDAAVLLLETVVV